MSKIKRLRKRFTAFVNQLTPDQCREQLVLAYLQMEKCQNVLKGYDVEPVEMMDNGDSSDLELFYRCKKAAEELAYLNEIAAKPDKTIGIKVEVDASEAMLRMKQLAEQFRKVHDQLNPRSITTGQEVYYLSKGRIHKGVFETIIGLVQENGEPVCRLKGSDANIPAHYLYDSAVRLASTIGKTVSNHVSLSSDHEFAFFIDSTNRVFKGAKWYLEDQKIENFASINDLRKFLLENIIDDGKQG